MSEHIDIVIPKYQFDPSDGEDISPVKRKILKTMEITETFTFWDVLKYIASMDKAIADKEAELKGLVEMKAAYMKELPLIEEQLNISNIEEEFQKVLAEENALAEASKVAETNGGEKKEDN